LVYKTPTKSEHPNNGDKYKRMVENASRLECKQCKQLVSVALFYDHVVAQQCKLQTNKSALSLLDDTTKLTFPSFLNERASHPKGEGQQDINTERSTSKISILEDKLRRADEILRESAIEI